MTGDGLGRGLSDMWRSVLLFLPAALAFIAILIIGYVLARLARTLVGKALHRVGFDKAVDRGALGRAMRGGKVTASDLCAKIVFYAVLLFALQLAFGVWGPNPVSDLLTALIAWLPRAFVAIVIIVVAAAIAGAAYDLIAGALGGLSYGRLLARAASVLIITLGVIAALDQVRIATAVTRPLLIAVLATVAGILIVGVGGGLVRPMQKRWEVWLERAGQESVAIREQTRTYTAEKARAVEAARRAEEERRAEEARLAEEHRKTEEARLAEEKRAWEARLAEERREAEEARGAEEARLAEEKRAWEVRLAEERRQAEEARAAEETRLAGERRQAEEAHRAEEAGLAEERRAWEARMAEHRRQAEEARRAEEVRLAEDARLAGEKRARRALDEERTVAGAPSSEGAREAERAGGEEIRRAEEERKAELARIADERRKTGAAAGGAEAATAERRAAGAEADTAQQDGVATGEAEDTQVIPIGEQRRSPVTDTMLDLEPIDDRPHMIPGFDRDEGENERTQVLPQPGESDETQVLPPQQPPGGGPTRPSSRRRRR